MPRRRVIATLRGRLLLLLLTPLVALAVVGASLDYLMARRLAGEAYDRALASAAIGLAARIETDRDNDLPAHLQATARAVGRLAADSDMRYLVLDGQGRRLSGDPALEALVTATDPGSPRLSDAWLQGQAVRVVTYGYEGPEGQATIVVAESMAKRVAVARQVLLQTGLTNLAMAVAVVLIAVLAVGVALRPLAQLGQRVQRLDGVEGAVAPAVQEFLPMALRGVPAETRPLIRAINRLMGRVRRSTQARLAFINNTAHQLRTPLAGLQAQAELLAAMPLAPDAAERAHSIQQAVRRLSHLTQQMLALARASERSTPSTPRQAVSLPTLLEDTASACIDAALARDIDLGFEVQPAHVEASAWMLRELLVNLIHNAIEHTPKGTTVTVRCGIGSEEAQGGACTPGPFLEVEDNGPGIAPQARERVFERFVRLSEDDHRGTGLGLSIVREIASRQGASVRILDGPGGRGTRVRVDFPAQRGPSPA